MHKRTALALAAATALLCAVTGASCGGNTSNGGGSGNGPDGSTSSSSGASSGGSSSGGSSSGGGGSSGDSGNGSSSGGTGSSSGTPGDGGPTCPSVPCTQGTCCADLTTDVPVCSTSCAADDTVQCLGPSTCGGATPDCCATDVLDGMDAGTSFPHCYTQSLTTKCVAKCVSSITLSCTATETLHVCQAPGDCADDTANPNCCVVAGYHVCVSTILMKLGSLSCL